MSHHHEPSKVLGQRHEPPVPSEYVLGRYGARLLSPTRSARSRNERELRPTAYVADRLILPAGKDGEAARTALESAADGLALQEEECHLLCQGGHDLDPSKGRLATAYRLVPDGSRAVTPDAWTVLEAARAKDPTAVARVTLDHLMFGPGIGGTIPYTSGHSTGLEGYGEVGSGGRQVVSWVGTAPQRTGMPDDERPRVALFDTGCGDHEWLRAGVVRYRVGSLSDGDDPEQYADQESPLLGQLDSHSGHGTFSAGIVRQKAPDADLMSVRVMRSDGVVQEWETLHALQSLRAQMQRWLAGDGGTRVDVVVLPLGYYHETPIDPAYTALLGDVLAELGRLGVVVVAAAGNDATSRPFYPAALSPTKDRIPRKQHDRVPVIAVGAVNPDGTTYALFNNHGEWIRAWRPGVSLVSTVPPMHGALQPTLKLNERLPGEHGYRATVDDDDFRGGFAVWSGTSFAAPVLAAEVAAAMLELDAEHGYDRSQWLERGWAAVEKVTSIRRAGRRAEGSA